MKRSGGFRRKTRHKLSKFVRQKGKIALTRFFRKFSEGERVCFHAEPAYQKGMYDPRFHGKMGIVKGMKGRCYLIEFKDLKKIKTAIVHPVHLKKV
jgi:large subunit ribosomal protein L21e